MGESDEGLEVRYNWVTLEPPLSTHGCLFRLYLLHAN